MKTYKKLCLLFTVMLLALFAGLNIFAFSYNGSLDGIYRVEAKRLRDEIIETGGYDLSDYPHITGVFTADGSDLFKSDEHYLIFTVNGVNYRAEYKVSDQNKLLIAADITIALMILLNITFMLYIKRSIINPFGKINSVPQELAKGNLAVEIPEEKSRFFGKFTWGINMLRENIEEGRKKELSMLRDKKLLTLSLSHDIKTPLSAIKLNAKALAKGLYNDEEKRLAAAESINARADEIESFVNRITQAASEDFMNFEVKMKDEYLSAVIAKIYNRYAPQLAVSGTEFVIGKYDERILFCDPDRLSECLQNLIENAIKYGDGKLIELSFECVDGCELITVSNTGCSLEDSELTQIFESFHRGSNSANIQGSGLGLFICRKLMNLMNGDIFAEISDGRFNVTLVVKIA